MKLEIHQMTISTRLYMTVSLLSSLGTVTGTGAKVFKKLFYRCFHHQSTHELAGGKTAHHPKVINTQIFLFLSHISQLLLNQSLGPALRISYAACKIIPKFPFTMFIGGRGGVAPLLCGSVWKSIWWIEEAWKFQEGKKKEKKRVRYLRGNTYMLATDQFVRSIVFSPAPKPQWHCVCTSTVSFSSRRSRFYLPG